jgi:hypothetical protein
LHLTGVVVWVGAAFLMTLLGTRASVARDPHRLVSFAGDAEWLGLRLYLPANALVLAAGFLLVEEGNWGYDRTWIELGLAGMALSFAIGAAFFGPGWPRVHRIADTAGEGSPAVRAAVLRLLLVSWLDLGVLLAVVFVMTIKPTGGDEAALAIAAVLPVVLAGIGAAFARAGRP